MKQSLKTVLFSLVLNQIEKKEIEQRVKNLIDEEMLNSLYALSKGHDLAHLVGNALEKNGLLKKSESLTGKFLKERDLAVFRCSQRIYDFSLICNVFEEAGIDFLPLKGVVISPLYPEPWMRTGCDIDVLVKESDLDFAINVLKNKAEFTTNGLKTVHDISLFSKLGTRLELHFTLTGSKSESNLTNVWSNAILKEGYKHWYLLTGDIFYLYHIKHMADHFKEGGCGIKPFIDLWLLYKNTDIRTKSLNLIKAEGFEKFESTIFNLVEAWFNGKELDETEKRVENYVVRGGTYGSISNRVALHQNKKGGKVKFLLYRVFMPYNELIVKYPRLKKCPLLFPFYTIKRWCNLLNRKTRKNSLNELKKTVEVNGQNKQEILKILKDLDI